MAFFKRNEFMYDDSEITIRHGDALDTNTKILLVKSIDLLGRIRREWRRRGIDIDMTCRMQLRQDCEHMERAICEVDQQRPPAKSIAKLENMYLRLKAEAEAVLKMVVED